MERIIYKDPNNNSQFIIGLLKKFKAKAVSGIWTISDLDLTPKFKGDYDGTGKKVLMEVSYNFYWRVMDEKIVEVSFDELISILEDTSNVKTSVIMCFKEPFSMNDLSFVPRAESDTPEEIRCIDAIYELRIFDGDIITVFKNTTQFNK